jgi:tripartite-type tricarboxylate transporter receptor subunit TctC
MLKVKTFLAVALLFALSGFGMQAMAQDYPTKTVRIVVPYTAGGPADLLARGLAQKLSETWGQPVIVDNRPGANEIIAAELVAKAPADGYTFLLASDAVFSLNNYL